MGQSGLLASKEITTILVCSRILSSAGKLEFHVIPIFINISHTYLSSQVHYLLPFFCVFSTFHSVWYHCNISITAFISHSFSSISFVYYTSIRNSLALLSCHCVNFFPSSQGSACHNPGTS